VSNKAKPNRFISLALLAVLSFTADTSAVDWDKILKETGNILEQMAKNIDVAQTAITVQRNGLKANKGGIINVFIDGDEQKNGIKDGQTKSYTVNNGFHTIYLECPEGVSTTLNFTASSQPIAFLATYEESSWLLGSPKCKLERIPDDTGKIQQNYNKQKNDNSSQNYDVAEELEKFANLKNKGIITEEEFNAKKKQLLGL
jgi:hypothetical protein